MADNYIERKYAEYEKRKVEWLKKQKHAIKRKHATTAQNSAKANGIEDVKPMQDKTTIQEE